MKDKNQSRWTELWKKEDYWAIWLGFIILILGMIIYLPRGPEGMHEKISKSNAALKAEAERAPFKTIAWYRAVDTKGKLKATGTPVGKFIKKFSSAPKKWSVNPLDAFFMSKEKAAAKKQKAEAGYRKAKEKDAEAMNAAKEAEDAAASEGFRNTELNAAAAKAIDNWRKTHKKAAKAKKKASIKPFNQVGYLIGLMVVLAAFFSIGMAVMKTEPVMKFFKGFLFVFFIAIISYWAANNGTMKAYGINSAALAIFFGMLISNTIGTPEWIKPAVKTEYYIKTGLVLLGAEILFGKILIIGLPGIFIAWVVTPIVLVLTFWFGQKVIKIASKELNITLSADMSVCGVSAAIATASACKAKKEELTLAIGLSLLFTAIMMVVMPVVIKGVGMPMVLGGAWMGGTIDSTGAVTAAGAFLNEKALHVAVTIKMIQNILIGVIAFFVALYWTAKVERSEGEKVSLMEIWYRFPKFVIGFIIASIIFSLIYGAVGKDAGYAVIDHGVVRGMSKIFRGWFFCLAFVSIGLATNFRELKEHFKGGKPLILYLCGQGFNLCLTLLIAYLMFYKIFPEITANI